LGSNKGLEIRIEGNREAKTLVIRDTGVGMTKKVNISSSSSSSSSIAGSGSSSKRKV